MKATKLFPLFFLLFSTLLCFGQSSNVTGKIYSDTADLSILNIFPDSFPNVSVVFKAETRSGEPVWNLTKDKIIVKENEQGCTVIFLENISKNKPINLGIVMDHSGSMQHDWDYIDQLMLEDKLKYDDDGNIIYPKGYSPPIENSKAAIKSFMNSFDAKKDKISLLGFSSYVDIRIPLSNDVDKISSIIDTIKADGSTAFYDAMMDGMDQIKKADGIKVLVAMTDGLDNSSKNTYKDVIKKANTENIPIYIIGLGNVNGDTLEMIANSTKGKFFYTKNSNSLSNIYSIISKQVQAFYELVYQSPNLIAADSTRQIEISFETDSLFLVTNKDTFDLPVEVKEHLTAKKTEREFPYLSMGIGVASVLLLGTLVFFYRRRKKKDDEPVLINKLFPNPTTGIFNLEYTAKSGDLRITDIRGNIHKQFTITGSEMVFDISDLIDGVYFATIYSGAKRSNTVRFILAK